MERADEQQLRLRLAVPARAQGVGTAGLCAGHRRDAREGDARKGDARGAANE